MANHVTSSIRINGTKELIDKVEEMFNHEKGGKKFEMKTEWLAKTVYDEYDWQTTPIGAKWCYLDDECRESDNEYYFTTVSAWSAPIDYLKKLTEVLVAIDDSTTIECTYQDEMPNFVGAFYGSKNGVVDREDEPDDRPDEEDFEDEDGEIDDYAYDDAVDSYYYGLDDLTQEILEDIKYEIDGESEATETI